MRQPQAHSEAVGQVEQVATQLLLGGLKRGALWLDTTSGAPSASKRIAAMLKEAGVLFMDAPVSGGPEGAAKGKLTVMVGGDAVNYQLALPVLNAIGTVSSLGAH